MQNREGPPARRAFCSQILDQCGRFRHSPGRRRRPRSIRGAGEYRMTRSAAVATTPELAAPGVDALDTFPKMLMAHARLRPGRPAMREKDYGIWQSWSWADIAAEVAALAGGLASLGFARGDKLAIIGDNRPPLHSAIAPAQALGGRPVP